MKKLISIILIIFCFSETSLSQTIQNSEPEEKLQQPKVVVFNPEGNSDSNVNSKEPEFRHMIKISPIMFINGDFPIFYEYRLGRNLSIEAAIGITHKDYIHELFEATKGDFSYDNEELYTTGNSFRSSLKYWPSKYGAMEEGYYFSIEYLNRNYNSTLTFEDYDNNTSEYIFYESPKKRNISEWRLLFGYVYYLDDKVFFEYFGGIGMGTVTTDGPYYDRNYNLKSGIQKRSRPNYIVGWKIGFSI